MNLTIDSIYFLSKKKKTSIYLSENEFNNRFDAKYLKKKNRFKAKYKHFVSILKKKKKVSNIINHTNKANFFF